MYIGNWHSLVHSTNLSDSTLFKDVWDGSVLTNLSQTGRFFSNQNNLALMLSTDGVPLFKSSSISMWPVYLVVLNLPREIRMNSENLLLCGLWVGPIKPEMNVLLGPIANMLKELSTHGITINIESVPTRIFAKLVLGVFDLPAKASVLNCKQYNGEYGCSVCYHPGKRLPNNTRIYLPGEKYSERNNDEMTEHGLLAEETKSCIFGVKGLSPLSGLFDLVKCVPVDYMHAVLEGVVRRLLKYWFDSENHRSPFYIGRHLRFIDAVLLKQHPPTEFSRSPRSIAKHVKYWKASELRNWLLTYSLPLLLDYLPSLYWHHYSLLVCAMHILLKDNTTNTLIDAAEQMLHDFCSLMSELYGETSCTANVHLLSHLCKYVRLWGPLWTHSTFGFENKNGLLKHYFHGRVDITHQLVFNVDVLNTMQLVTRQLQLHESDETMGYLISSSNRWPNKVSICEGIHIVGKTVTKKPSLEESAAISCNEETIEVFYRMYSKGVIFHSTSYSRCSGKRDNSNCCFFNSAGRSISIGQIVLFIKHPQPLVLLNCYKKLDQSITKSAGNPCRSSLSRYQEIDLLDSYIMPVELDRTLIAVPITSIISKIVIVCQENKLFCVIQPNSFERH